MKPLTCISIDDNPLFTRKLEAFTESLDWISIVDSYDNPIQGATAIVNNKPDVVFLDIEMPYIDGEYLADWIKPKLEMMDNPPQIIVISSVTEPPEELLANTAGFINKSTVTDPEAFEKSLKAILG
ncbi:LytR/AlgR family response regulator transcription factor [Ekhidna sp.]|uniref:LytR/AlgR family response regulator transcription factor n=1 Tax=Ekhidna sp. TaxID=2608089 RepID=UPI003299D844